MRQGDFFCGGEKTLFFCVEICSGAGGQSLGLEKAGFKHLALVEYEKNYCEVLKKNRPNWNVICEDVHNFSGKKYLGADLFAAGVPCPPFSVASKQLGENDERDLFPETLRLIEEIQPRAIMIENVKGFLDKKFDDYREKILNSIENLGYQVQIKLLNALDFGVSQVRQRIVIVGIKNDERGKFFYPEIENKKPPTVGELLKNLMKSKNWRGADDWAKKADGFAPTIVGGSKKHGGPDLGPVRAKKAWALLGVDGNGIANDVPEENFVGIPRLTKEMIALIQGFPPEWNFGNKKTSACRMIGNAFPPPVAEKVGIEIRKCLEFGKNFNP